MLEIDDAFFQKAGGWQAVQQARALLASDQVLSSNWTPPLLRGVVRSGDTTLRSGLVIRSVIDIDNMCSCRTSREFGTLCPHSIAVGLHHIRRIQEASKPKSSPSATNPSTLARGDKDRLPTPSSSSLSANRPTKSSDASRLQRTTDPKTPEIELDIILPPNLADSFAKGRVLMVVEGVRGTTRRPLNGWLTSGPCRLDTTDARLLDALENITGGETPGMVQLSAADFTSVLPALAGHPRITMGRQRPVEIDTNPFFPPARAELQADGTIQLRITQAASAQHSPAQSLKAGSQTWLLHTTDAASAGGKVNPAKSEAPLTLQPVVLPESMEALWKGPVTLKRTEIPAFLGTVWRPWSASGQGQANFSLADFEMAPAPPKFHLNLTGGLARLTATLQAAYGSQFVAVGITSAQETAWLPDPSHPTRYGTRDHLAEKEALQKLRLAGFGGPNNQGQWELSGQDRVVRFFSKDHPRWAKEWTIHLEERLERGTQQRFETVAPRFEVRSSGEQWFEMDVSYESASGERLGAADIQQLLQGGTRRLKNGRLAVLDPDALDEFQEALRDCAAQQMQEGATTRLRVDRRHAGFLDDTLRSNGIDLRVPAAWKDQTRPWSGAVQFECPSLGTLENVLRPYQKQGVAWLEFLRQNNFGGVLADEMGLGKTLQVLAHIQNHRTPGRPNLVVCPTSLVFNWEAEAARFTPHLRTLALHGPDRHRLFSKIPDQDLVITSYALVRRDLEHLGATDFNTLILDEAQHIKNRATRNAQAVKSLRSDHRLILTGTPLENSVLDLWSLFDFLMPAYLGTADDFRERYEVPITREKDPSTLRRLSRRIRPFLLRRTKLEVVKDLPPKIEQIAWCDLNEDQAAIYQQLLSATREKIFDSADPKSPGKNRMLVLTALLRLRQACCDLRLFQKPDPNEPQNLSNFPEATVSSRADSNIAPGGKVQMFGELLDEILDGGHRVLVFSQFTSMLHLLREELIARDIACSYLDGQTRDRAAVVNEFQNNASIPVFLISLKAGGVGLNLTGADTVIHFDPWWNPAVEDQATDRAHRIGQTRSVTSYKLITRNTVEEKILHLQQKKRQLAGAALSGEEGVAESLSWDEIRELFA